MRDLPYDDPAVLIFLLLPIVLLAALTWAAVVAWRRDGRSRAAAGRVGATCAIAGMLWMSLTWQTAENGVLRQWGRTPPPFAIFVVAILALALLIALTPLGAHIARHVALWALVAIQGFRLPLELAMHTLYERGIMPEQMSYSGRNFDIVTGISAIAVAALAATGRGGRRLVMAWNILGLGLLLNIIIVAILSTPRVQYFGPDRLNTFVTYTPFVWLPAVMVLAALAGHLLVFRALRARR